MLVFGSQRHRLTAMGCATKLVQVMDIASEKPITTDEFRNRLVELCLRSGMTGLPRKPRDRHILLKSITLGFDPKREYAENEVDQELLWWLREVGIDIHVDHVNLRRQLIDHAYLGRTKDGSRYWVGLHVPVHPVYEPGIQDLDLPEEIRMGKELIERRKQEYLRRISG